MSKQQSGSTWRKPWTKLDLSFSHLSAVFKSALPQTAALWIIQATVLAQDFDTVGFLPIIITILMTPSLPRIPYLRLLIFTLFLNCIILCVALLAGWCADQARIHTTPPGGNLSDYNSSAAAVSGIWLMFTVWALQTFRTYNPHRAKSVVLCTIFTNVSMIFQAELHDMKAIIAFDIQLFETMLVGYALSACSSLFIFPLSSRDVTSSDIAKMVDASEKSLSTDVAFGSEDLTASLSPKTSPAATQVLTLCRTFAKFQIDVSDAKKDIGYSRYSPEDFSELVHHFRVLTITLRGLFAVETVRSSLYFGQDASKFDKESGLVDPEGVDGKQEWDELFAKLQLPMSRLARMGEDAMNHVRISLRIRGYKKVKKAQQEEHVNGNSAGGDAEKASQMLPGGTNFVANFRQDIDELKNELLLLLIQLKDKDEENEELGKMMDEKDKRQRGGKKRRHGKRYSPTAAEGRLLFMLYIEHLYNGILDALFELVIYCDQKSQHSKRILQVPGKKQCIKAIRRLTQGHQVDGDVEDVESEIPKLTHQRSRMPVDSRKDSTIAKTRHTALKWLQTIGVYVNKPSEVLASAQSFFGLRVACAVMSVAIVAYLGQTQQWFFNQRGIWAAVFIPFSMAPSSGEAKAMLMFRVLGTLLSIPLSLINWYIVDGVPAGVIVIYFVNAFIQQYFMIKYPKWGSFWRPCIITTSIIVGYSLQAKVTHVPQPPATTDARYGIYIIGPYRCLCTLIGVSIAYVWTVFPQPTTANSVMRRRLGQALFTLGEYHSCMHEAISSWAWSNNNHYDTGDMRKKGTIANRLMKVRRQLLVKETAILTVIRDQHEFAKFDISLFGNGFPEHRYVAIADEVDRIMSYLNVVIFVSAYFHKHRITQSRLGSSAATPLTSKRPSMDDSNMSSPWDTGAPDLLRACRSTSREIAALIHILASSVTNNQPLPPFLVSPEPFAVARRLNELRPDLMNVKHMVEEGYKAFAVIEVSVAMLIKSLDKILESVRDMVGEVGVDITGLDKSEDAKIADWTKEKDAGKEK